MIALVASLWVQQHLASERAQKAAELRSRRLAQEQATESAKRRPPPTPDQQRLSKIAAELRQPWLPTLRLIENATEAPIFLTGLAMEPANTTVRINGEAPSFEQVLAYARTLNEPGLISEAELRSHEQATDPNGRDVVRFSISARWAIR